MTFIVGVEIFDGTLMDAKDVNDNIDAIKSVVNGQLDNANLKAAAAIAISKLAGYPANGAFVLKGDGTWGIAPVSNLPPSSIAGFPNDANKVLKGDGSWNLVGDSSIIGVSPAKITGYPSDGNLILKGDGTWGTLNVASLPPVPPSGLIGYPADASKALLGDGTWKQIENAQIAAAAAIGIAKLAGYPADATKVLKGDGSWGVHVTLPADTVVPAATRIIANKLSAADTYAAWRVMGDGRQDWGPGGTTAPDVSLYRVSSQILETSGVMQAKHSFGAGLGDPIGSFGFWTNTPTDFAPRWLARNSGQMEWGDGSTLDTNLYRPSANNLKTDGWLLSARDVYAWHGDAVRQGYMGDIGGKAGIALGPAGDTTLYRSAPGILRTGGLDLVNPGTAALRVFNAGADTSSSFRIVSDGKMWWGPGGITSADTNLYRSAAGVLKTDGQFEVGAAGLKFADATVMTTAAVGGGGGALPADTVIPAATRIISNKALAGDANPAWRVLGSGRQEWGRAGGTYVAAVAVHPTDTALSFTGGLYSDQMFRVMSEGFTTSLAFTARSAGMGDTQDRIAIDAGGTVWWGTGAAAVDVSLYRGGAGLLQTNSQFKVGAAGLRFNDNTVMTTAAVGGGGGALPADTVVPAGTRIIENKLLAGDAQPSWRVRGDGSQQWGPGGATAPDTNLYRSGAGYLRTDTNLWSSGVLISGTSLASGGIAYYSYGSGDTNARIQILNNGKVNFGPGNAVPDTNLYRAAADTLRTDDSLQVGGAYFANYGLTWLDAAGTAARVVFGSAQDTNLYRSAAGNLKTDGTFWVGQSLVVDASNGVNRIYLGGLLDASMWRSGAGQITSDSVIQSKHPSAGFSYYPNAASGLALASAVAGESGDRFWIGFQGNFTWGIGNGTMDTNLYRSAAGVLKTDSKLQVVGPMDVGGPIVGSSWAALNYGTVNQLILGDISNWLGAPADRAGFIFGNVGDTTLYRANAGQLKTDTQLAVAGLSFHHWTGAPNWSVLIGSPANGMTIGGDTNLYRSSAGNLKTDGQLQVGGLSYANVGTANQVVLGYSAGAAPAIAFGAAADATIFRAAPGRILTGSVFGSQHGGVWSYLGSAYTGENGWMGGYWAGSLFWDGTNWTNETGGGNNGWAMWACEGAGGGMSFYTEPNSGAVQRTYTPAQMQALRKLRIDPAGQLVFGPAGDTTLYRSAAAVLKTAGMLDAGTGFLARGTGASWTIRVLKDAEAAYRFGVDASGKLLWDSGAAGTYDTNLYRASADNLQTDDTFWANQFVASNGTVWFGLQVDTRLWRTAAGTLRFNGPNFSIVHDGARVYFGTADDTYLGRISPGVLGINGVPISTGGSFGGAVRAYRNSYAAIASTEVTFEGSDYAAWAGWNGGTHIGVNGAGLYQVVLHSRFSDGGGAGDQRMFIKHYSPGGAELESWEVSKRASDADMWNRPQTGTVVCACSAGDFFTAQIHGGATGSPGGYSEVRMTVIKIG